MQKNLPSSLPHVFDPIDLTNEPTVPTPPPRPKQRATALKTGIDLTQDEDMPMDYSAVSFKHIPAEEEPNALRNLNSEVVSNDYMLNKLNDMEKHTTKNCGSLFDAFTEHANPDNAPIPPYSNQSLHIVEVNGKAAAAAQVSDRGKGHIFIDYLCGAQKSHMGGGEAILRHLFDHIKSSPDSKGNYKMSLAPIDSAIPRYRDMGMSGGDGGMWADKANPLKDYTDTEGTIPVTPLTTVQKIRASQKEKKRMREEYEEAERRFAAMRKAESKEGALYQKFGGSPDEVRSVLSQSELDKIERFGSAAVDGKRDEAIKHMESMDQPVLYALAGKMGINMRHARFQPGPRLRGKMEDAIMGEIRDYFPKTSSSQPEYYFSD